MKGFNFHFIFHAIGLCLVIVGIIFGVVSLMLFLIKIGVVEKTTLYPFVIVGGIMFVVGFYLMYVARKYFSKEEKAPSR